MTRAVRSEMRKFFTTRMWWGMAIAVVLAGVAFALLFALTAGIDIGGGQKTQGLSEVSVVRGVYTGGLSIGYLLTLAVGVMTIGSEYRHKTITSTFLSTPKRTKVMTAKVISLLVIGCFYGVLSMLASVGVGAAVISAKGFSAFPDSSVWRSIALGLLVLGLWALIGLGAGILIPNQVAALLISIGFAFILEPILRLVLSIWEWGRTVADYLPGAATQAALGTNSGSADGGANAVLHSLEWWQGALVLVAYAAVMAVVGSMLTVRRDIA